MSESFGRQTRTGAETVDRNLGTILGVATGLIALNILAMLALSYVPPVVGLGSLLFGNIFVGMATFAISVGGGSWVASKGVQRGSMVVAGAGVTLVQAGYGLFGAVVLGTAASALRVPAVGISIVVTAVLTAAVAAVVFRSDRSFESWQNYSFYLFIAGIGTAVVGALAFTPLLVVASLLFFAGFVTSLTYEIWAVKANRYASSLRNALGIYVAVMGVFVNVLVWVLRILELLDL